MREICRTMFVPKMSDWEKLKRQGRYLVNKTRVVTQFRYQAALGQLEVWTDTDHAGCLQTRKSTSGGVKIGRAHV